MIKPTTLSVGSEQLSLAEVYHHATSYPAKLRLTGGIWRQRPPLYTCYSGAPVITLDPVDAAGGPAVLDACQHWHTPVRRLQETRLSLEQLTSLLFFAQGLSGSLQMGGQSMPLRTAPSAGALYPVDLYVAASNVDGLEPGLYHYQVANHSLEQLSARDHRAALARSSASPTLLTDAAATVLIAVAFARSGAKYRERCYRYVAMDAGHAAANLGVAAVAQGLSAPVVSRFEDTAINTMLGFATREQAVLALMPIGQAGDGPADPEPTFALDPEQDPAATTDFLDLMHGGTSLVRTNGIANDPTKAERSSSTGWMQLPQPTAGRSTLATIRQRRSHRQFDSSSLSLETLASLVAAATVDTNGPYTTAAPRMHLYVAVRAVRGLQPGLYLTSDDGRGLSTGRRGSLAAELYALAFRQGFCASAQAVFVIATSWPELLTADGDRGYRIACLSAGILGNALYLQATGLGLGACGVGAFNDDKARQLIASDRNPTDELVLYLVAVGQPPATR